MDVILKVWCQIENLTPSIDVYLMTMMMIYMKDIPAKFHRYLISKDRVLGYFEDDRPQQAQKDE